MSSTSILTRSTCCGSSAWPRTGGPRSVTASPRRASANCAVRWRSGAAAPLVDLLGADLMDREADRLHHVHLATFEDWIDGTLELGSHADVLDDLAPMVEANPLREHLTAAYMRALYRSGRGGTRSASTSRHVCSSPTSWGSIPGRSCASSRRRSCSRIRP